MTNFEQLSRAEQIESSKNSMILIANNVTAGLYGVEEEAKAATDALFAGQHILLEGDPGLGKTALAENFALSIAGSNGKIMGVPDRMPADVMGSEIYIPATGEFKVRPGPIFKNIILVDEINRFNPKTQAALHEVMDERKVTLGDMPFYLPNPFFVIATQNQNAYGQQTSQLNNALSDRFAISKHYVPLTEQDRFNGQTVDRTAKAERITDVDTLKQMIEVVQSIHIEESAIRFAARAFTIASEAKGIDIRANGHRTMNLALEVAKARTVRNGGVVVDIATVAEVFPLVLDHRIDLKSSDEHNEKTALIETFVASALKAA